jgi:hypothetical protein
VAEIRVPFRLLDVRTPDTVAFEVHHPTGFIEPVAGAMHRVAVARQS